jgi:hypothetical protein
MAKGNRSQASTAAAAVPAATPNYPTDVDMRNDGLETLSARIRHLSSLGCPTAEIARIVVRGNGAHPKYQHVRNVLKQPLKGAPTPAAS